jgi:hypothetical protein
VVEATCRIHSSGETEFVERLVPGFGSELAEDAKGLVEQYHHNAVFRINSKAKIRFSCVDRRRNSCFCRKKDAAIEKSLSLQFEIMCDLAHQPCEKL